jgi:hypothetical protein
MSRKGYTFQYISHFSSSVQSLTNNIFFEGDLDPEKPPNQPVCVLNMKDFSSCFLFSIETQHTIG